MWALRAELGQHRLDFCLGCKAPIGCIAQAAVDAFELRFGRFVLDVAQASVDVERNLGKLA
jgi:hypothetical protein